MYVKKTETDKDEQKSWSPEEALDQKGACFVSLKTKKVICEGVLALFFRHIHPFGKVIENAIAAASEDPVCAGGTRRIKKYRRFCGYFQSQKKLIQKMTWILNDMESSFPRE